MAKILKAEALKLKFLYVKNNSELNKLFYYI